VEISPEDLWDLVGTRIEIESIGLRRSIELGEVNWEASVLSTHHVLEGTPIRDLDGPRTSVAWDRAHEAFHDALIGACGLSRLTAFARTLRDSSELYRQISGAHQDGDRDVLGEHRELMQLSTDRKADAAVEALARHLRLTAELALKNV
jgi:DNA-binding GntR family transcriptional regulator